MKSPNFKIFSLFFFSIALIAYELFVMRVFSVGSWSNFGSLVISTALLGYGIAGTLLTFIIAKVSKAPNRWMTVSAILFIPAMVLGYIVSQYIPFNPVFIGSDPKQFLWIAVYYVVYGLPFFIGALFIGVAFIVLSNRIHKLYFWNMAGSGLGGLVILLFMYFLPPDRLIVPLILLAFLAALLVSLRRNQDTGRSFITWPRTVALIVLTVASIAAVFTIGNIRVSEYKSISYVQKYPDAKLVHHSYTPEGEFHVYASSYFHFAPGLSDNAIVDIEEMPKQAFWGLYVDGNGPVGIMGKLMPEEEKYFNYLPMSAPYGLLREPNVLLVNLGGGISAQVGLHHQAKSITIVEQDPELVKLLRDDPVISRFNDNLLDDPKINTLVGEPRAYCVRHKGKFDLVEISLVDSVGLSQTGGYAVQEDYTYTREAISEYMGSLRKNGILSITVWNRLNPPRNVPKLLCTIVDSLRAQGVEHPEERIFAFDLFLSTATVIVKNSAFTKEEIDTLYHYADRMSFDVFYYPGMPLRDKDFTKILAQYIEYFERNSLDAATQISDFSSSDIYHYVVSMLLQGKEKALYEDYVFDIKPMTDARPYYSAYLKTGKLGMYLDQLQDVSEEWGYLVLLGTLLESIFFALIIILMPVIGRWKELFGGRRGTLGIIVYFACLGLGYMLIEIYLIQRLVFFLSNPVFSVSIVITFMLIISGLGSIVSSKIKLKRTTIVRIAAVVIAGVIAFYIFGLTPVLNAFLGVSFFLKCLITVLIIAPAAFFLGVPFPNGLAAITEKRPKILPWAWGMNGALSVTGSMMATLISVSKGFPVVLFTAMGLYILAGILFPANERDI